MKRYHTNSIKKLSSPPNSNSIRYKITITDMGKSMDIEYKTEEHNGILWRFPKNDVNGVRTLWFEIILN